jgi:hypothetical protein
MRVSQGGISLGIIEAAAAADFGNFRLRLCLFCFFTLFA